VIFSNDFCMQGFENGLKNSLVSGTKVSMSCAIETKSVAFDHRFFAISKNAI
jgi:hypothetical protein